MRGHSLALYLLQQMRGDRVVENAFGFDGAQFLRVKSGCIIFEELDIVVGVVRLVDDLGLAFVNLVTRVP